MTKFEQFLTGYIKCLYFIDTGDCDDPPSDARLSMQAHEHINLTCRTFWDEFEDVILESECVGFDVTKEERAGFDFYLTRNGHGSGFWDGYWSEPHGDILTKGSGDGISGDHVYLDDTGYLSIA